VLVRKTFTLQALLEQEKKNENSLNLIKKLVYNMKVHYSTNRKNLYFASFARVRKKNENN
jgi:hypothetical protein